MEPSKSIDPTAELKGRQSLEAVKVLSCRSCKAPGVWRAAKNAEEEQHYGRWPGCLVPSGDSRDGTPVGGFCPNCGASRVGLIERLGEIWHRFRS